MTNDWQNPRNGEPRCDFDTWTVTTRTRLWLKETGATELARHSGFTFYEHPTKGDNAPVLAIRTEGTMTDRVLNTQDFDVPTGNPKEAW